MSVNGVLLVAVSWEAVEGLAISNELCKPSQDFPDAFRGLDVLLGGLTLHYCMGWEEWLKLLPRALSVLSYLCHSVRALQPMVRCPK